MHYIKEYMEKYADHPNLVKVQDLKVGDFFVIIHDGEYINSRHHSTDKVWRCSNSPSLGEYRSSVFATCVSMANHVSALQTSCIYLWFGKDATLLKLPKKQQTIYRRFYNDIQKNDDVHQLGWSDWGRNSRK